MSCKPKDLKSPSQSITVNQDYLLELKKHGHLRDVLFIFALAGIVHVRLLPRTVYDLLQSWSGWVRTGVGVEERSP